MSNILNKSSHPVHVNRIPVRMWCLRDEIEQAVSERMKECAEKGVELDISDIKEFYTKVKKDFSSSATQNSEDKSDVLSSEQNTEDEKDALEKLEDIEAKEKDEHTDNTESSPDQETEAAQIAEMIDQGEPNSKENSTVSKRERILPDASKISKGFAFLSDIDMVKILSFSSQGFTMGKNVCIEFLIPNGFTMTGEVVASNHVGRNSKIISESKLDYRIMTTFSFLFDQERDNLREFLKSIEPDIPPSPKKLKRPMDDDEDDEFEDLGF